MPLPTNNTPKSDKERKPVQVVVAQSSFPDFSSFTSYGKRKSPTTDSNTQQNTSTKRSKGIDLDLDATVKEIHALGSSQFTGKQKKEYEAEQYKTLTGRDLKKQHVPVKIVRGIKKAAAKREARINKEAKEAGVVTHKTPQNKNKKKSFSVTNRRDARVHGPAPSIGFTKKGTLRVKTNNIR